MDDQNTLISARQLSATLGEPDLRILDCRFDLLKPDAGRAAHLAGHIPSAIYADLNNDLAAPVRDDSGRHPLPDEDTAAATFGRLGVSNNSRVVVYDDQGGAIAARAWWMLRWLGHGNVSLLDGGLPAWTTLDLPLETGPVSATQESFVAAPQQNWAIETGELQAGQGVKGRLIDARAAHRFRGVAEPIDAVAGHVPGAVNLPFEQNLESDGRWRPADQLRQLWLELLDGNPETPCSVMCGSGVTACHLVVAAELAGIRRPRLYAGSWSEWIRDPGRQIATGPA